MSGIRTGFVIGPSEGDAWDMEPGRPVVFKLLGERTGGSVAIFEEAVPAGAGTPLHIHHTSDEVLYVQAGSFTLRLGEEQRLVEAGSWIFIPLGALHGWRNHGATEGRLLNIFAPAAGARAFEQMRLQGVPVPEVDPAVRTEIFQSNGYEFVTWEW